MSVLSLEHVAKTHRHGSREVEVLRDVCLELESSELVAIWGLRRSGRSTLLRIAAGIEAPDAGGVRFEGRELGRTGQIACGIAYCRPAPLERGAILEALVWVGLMLGMRPTSARSEARGALERTGVAHCAERAAHELDRTEAVRVSIARGLVQRPALLLIDDPISGVELMKRDGILKLLRSLRAEGQTILTCVDNGTGLIGADRALALSYGVLRGVVSPEMAEVVELPLRISG